MNSILNAWALKLPVIRRYVDRVRMRHEAAELEIARLRREAYNYGLRISELTKAGIDRDRALELATAQLASVARERDSLTADFMAAKSACANAFNLLAVTRDQMTMERNRIAEARWGRPDAQFPTDIVPADDVFPIEIVDVGAQMLDMMDHVYAPLLRDHHCSVVGFEPLGEEAARRAASEPTARILPYFIGDGEAATFHINAYNPTSSIYPSNPAMKKFQGLAIVLPTLSTEPVVTRRLDDIPEVERCDYLKIDVQGAELKVLIGAPRHLAQVSMIHLEVEHDEVYLGQPLFAEIDIFLRAAGFELIDLSTPGYDTYQEAPPGCTGSRLLWHDALYMKRVELMSDAMLLKAAYIAHANYQKYDLTAHLLAAYDGRRKTSLWQQYKAYIADVRARALAAQSEETAANTRSEAAGPKGTIAADKSKVASA